MFESTCNKMISNAKSLVEGKCIKHVLYGEGRIISVDSVSKANSDFIISIDFNGMIKMVALRKFILESGKVLFCDYVNLEELNTLLSDVDIVCSKKLKEESEEVARKRAEDKQRLEDAKQQAKEEERLRKVEVKFNNDIDSVMHFQPSTIEWIAERCTNIIAKMPSELEKYFIKKFGSDVPYSVIDSSKKTSGGFKMQYTFSFSIHFKSLDNIPAELEPYFTTKTKKISNTALVCSLINNYGFKFGKIQELDEIKKYI